MAERDRASVHVDLVHVGLQLDFPGLYHRGKGLVDLGQVDVIHGHVVALEDLPGGRDRAGKHDHRVDTDRSLVDDPGAGLQTELVGLFPGHQQHRGGTVGNLGGVAGSDLAVFLERRLEAGQTFEAGAGPNSLVGAVGVTVDLEGRDLPLEATFLGGLLGPGVGADSELVEVDLGDLPLVGDHLGRDALVDQVVLLEQLGRVGVPVLTHHLGGIAEGEVTHVLDTATDHHVMDAGSDHRRGVVDRLLGRTALAVDRGGRSLDREAGLEPGVAPDVDALLTELLDTAGHDVLDLGRVDARPLDDVPVGVGQESRRMGVLVVPLLLVAAANRGANRLHDYDFTTAKLAHFLTFFSDSVTGIRGCKFITSVAD